MQRPSSVPPQQEWTVCPAAGNVARQVGGDGGGCEWCRARWAAVWRWSSATAWCRAHQCGMQSAPSRGQRWGTGRSKAGGNRPRRWGRGGVPEAPVRDSAGGNRHRRGAGVRYREHTGGRQSAVPSGQRWGTGSTRAGGNRHRRGGRGGVPGAPGREIIGTAVRVAGGGKGVRCW